MSALPTPEVTVPLRPVERLATLCDPGSLRLLRTAVRSERLGERVRKDVRCDAIRGSREVCVRAISDDHSAACCQRITFEEENSTSERAPP